MIHLLWELREDLSKRMFKVLYTWNILPPFFGFGLVKQAASHLWSFLSFNA